MTKLERERQIETLASAIRALAIFIRQWSTMSVTYNLQKRWEVKLKKDGLMEILALPMRA